MRHILFILVLVGCISRTEVTKKEKLLGDIKKNFDKPWSYTTIDESRTLAWDSLFLPYYTRINVYPPEGKDTLLIYFLDAKYKDTAMARMTKGFVIDAFTSVLHDDSLARFIPQINFNDEIMAVTYLTDTSFHTSLVKMLNDKFGKDFGMNKEARVDNITLEDIRQEEEKEEPPPPPPPKPGPKARKVKG